ncbi:NmrA family NAD(P)-binding protein [Microbacterium sp. 1P06AB]|uniref:NmrA family NAD(P)-binding protein n=1 Tax=Microbacterium sp. 1P06AB TaxID=3132289 RepID=UPI0039A453E9
MTILVTAAGGQLGHLVVDALLARGASPDSIVAGARTVAKAADLADKGVRVVPLDYTAPESIAAALEGVDSVLLISGSEPGSRVAGHVNVIDAAVRAGVTKLVYTSLSHADTADLVLAPDHKATEEAIAASGIPAVLLRNNWYIENYAGDLAGAAQTGVLSAAVGDAAVGAAARVDYAAAAAVVLLEDGHIGRTYELAGPRATYADIAAAMGEVLGREVVYAPATPEELAARLASFGLDEGTVGFVVALDAGIASGALDATETDLTDLIGRPTTSWVDALRALAPAA